MASGDGADALGSEGTIDGGVVVESAETELKSGVEDAEQEAQPLTPFPTPDAFTASQLAEHRDGGHIPYRPQCDECVEAFGREEGHSSHGHVGGRRIAVVSLDYLFITPSGLFTRQEVEQSSELTFEALEANVHVTKVLVMYCSLSRAVFAHAVRRKGADEQVVQQIVDDIAWLGHTRLVLRSDNEPAMLALVSEALKVVRMQLVDIATVSSEGSVPYDPQTNGAVEVAVRNVKSSLKANLLTLEKRIGAKISHGHVILTWLIRHSALMRTIRMRASDGRTAYERARGTQCSSTFLGFE